jgi:hypothetical protein
MEKLSKSSSLINSFIDYCESKQIKLTQDNFNYIRTIGIIATYPNIVFLLNDKISNDKEGLVDVNILNSEFKKEYFASGYYISDKYIVMAHPYFRRAYSKYNNFAPRFIDIFCKYNKKSIQKYIAIDSDRVRINVDHCFYLELDTWYGAKFRKSIHDIQDGIVKLRPPLGLDPIDVYLFFGNIYSLDIKWSSKNGIKVFQAEEFKTEQKGRIIKNGEGYYPVKYLHAEFDSNAGIFRHLDGAIHFYKKDEYYLRRDSDFNYNTKSSLLLKPLSQKLFKINGKVTIEEWIELVSHYLTGNPLVFEYFEGKLPDHTLNLIKEPTSN